MKQVKLGLIIYFILPQYIQTLPNSSVINIKIIDILHFSLYSKSLKSGMIFHVASDNYIGQHWTPACRAVVDFKGATLLSDPNHTRSPAFTHHVLHTLWGCGLYTEGRSVSSRSGEIMDFVAG